VAKSEDDEGPGIASLRAHARRCGEAVGGGEEEVVDVAVGSPGLIFGNEDEEGGKVV
jgi:hypothetical protein